MRITDLNQLFTASLNNVLYIIDTNDTGSFLSGSSKQITVGNFLSSSGVFGNGTSSYSLNAITSSYSFTSSYALNSGTAILTGSNYPITSSWSINAFTASYSLTASYALNAVGGGIYLSSESFYANGLSEKKELMNVYCRYG